MVTDELRAAVERVKERFAAADSPIDRIVASNSEGVIAGLLALSELDEEGGS